MISTPHRQTAIALINDAVTAGAWRANACAELEAQNVQIVGNCAISISLLSKRKKYKK